MLSILFFALALVVAIAFIISGIIAHKHAVQQYQQTVYFKEVGQLYTRDVARYAQSPYYERTGLLYTDVMLDDTKRGEYDVFEHLLPLESQGARLIPNVYLPKHDGKTAEVDLVMVHESGVYAIEVKTYKGWIFGNENDKQWTVAYQQGRGRSARKEHFYNPLRQNQTHTILLKKLIPYNIPVHSIVVFAGTCKLKNVTAGNLGAVIKLENLSITLPGSSGEQQDKVASIIALLSPYAKASIAVKIAHVIDVSRYVRGDECPWCGSKLVQRHGKYGDFLGCSGYPKCRFTREVDKK